MKHFPRNIVVAHACELRRGDEHCKVLPVGTQYLDRLKHSLHESFSEVDVNVLVSYDSNIVAGWLRNPIHLQRDSERRTSNPMFNLQLYTPRLNDWLPDLQLIVVVVTSDISTQENF